MTPEQASTIAEFLISAAERECETTRRVLAAVPADKVDFTPHPKSMTAGQLAWHVASSEIFLLSGITDGQFDVKLMEQPESVKTPADIVAWHAAEVRKVIDRLKNLPAETWSKVIPTAIFERPAIDYLLTSMTHMIHHRGQLTVYLRLMGASVPSIYGPSADESHEAEEKAASA